MLSAYPACFFKESNGYSVIFPDLNWLATCGESLEEAFTPAVDCLAGYLYMNKKEGLEPSKPSSVNDIDLSSIAHELDVSDKEAFVNLVTVDVDAYAKLHFEISVKKTLTIPAWLNKAGLERGLNFSKVLQDALIAEILGTSKNK